MNRTKAIHSDKEYEEALEQLSKLWGARRGTPEGDRLDELATLLDAYETIRYPMDMPNAEAITKFRAEQERDRATKIPQNIEKNYVFQIYQDRAGLFFFRLVSPAGEIMLISEAYRSKSSVVHTIKRLKSIFSTTKSEIQVIAA
ncbi:MULTISPECIES: DUF1508 domain-containing protein [unclassified Rhizobium]|uniref:DUF1508 domain-containing protein n=1 Tax=unclassified Rhizobium TaxID=2613769 RepID=UPI000EAA4E67|nr:MULTISPECIES: DUF1508 domain-containing protein [unclassified Rhizobium]AYG66942.1 DUF1508 domain-containing protein [Rhizobium sp. CCGE531]AYG73322.1 DUF1508 domain-containing protein [Rhizobium sp. CCGE532]